MLIGERQVKVGRLEEAEDSLRGASERRLESSWTPVFRYDIAFLKGDQAAMERAATLGREKSGAEDWILHLEAFTLAYSGHLRQARATARRAADLARQAGHREKAVLLETGAVLWEALFGSVRDASAEVRPSVDREVQYGAALALALAGDSSRSQTLADDLERRFPEATSVRFSYLPTLRAILALHRGEPSKAIDLLQAAAPYELGAPRSFSHGNFGSLYPVYVRGLAYLAERQGSPAAAEFQKILAHRGIIITDPVG